ncbi:MULTISPECIES: CinA family protein [Micrococcaceae]|uniref:CinA family protein n=1 Tax=unclassified Kocuria TaxID=2649579 RepID=UPI0010105F4A|nr:MULTISPECIES: CinA family protein [unclassified Kocuria]
MSRMGVPETESAASLAARIVASATVSGQTISTAESLTAGMVASTICSVSGASAAFWGGVVSYDNSVKAGVLGVRESLLADKGSVDPDVARAMAAGARHVCGTDWGISTTGVAGPEPHDGKPVGLVYIGCASPLGFATKELRFHGDRAEIREQSVRAALRLLLETMILDA